MAAFIVRIFKSWGARDPERRWVNTYEFNGTTLASPPEYEAIVSALLEAEMVIHLTDVQFLEATVSTWLPDSHPYDPDAFATFDLDSHGLRGNDPPPNNNALDSNVCLLVKRKAHTGRSGKLFYRGVLLETDVQMGGDGRFTLTPGTNIYPGGAAEVSYQGAMEAFLSGGEGDAALSLISKIGATTHIRAVEQLVFSAVTVNSRNHRYFDRHTI